VGINVLLSMLASGLVIWRMELVRPKKGRKPDDVGSILDLAAHGINSAALDRWLI
jgi:hypothetical protein